MLCKKCHGTGLLKGRNDSPEEMRRFYCSESEHDPKNPKKDVKKREEPEKCPFCGGTGLVDGWPAA